MCPTDRRERTLASQSVNKYILSIQEIYKTHQFLFASVIKAGKSFTQMGPLLNSSLKRISLFPEKVIIVIRLKFSVIPGT